MKNSNRNYKSDDGSDKQNKKGRSKSQSGSIPASRRALKEVPITAIRIAKQRPKGDWEKLAQWRKSQGDRFQKEKRKKVKTSV